MKEEELDLRWVNSISKQQFSTLFNKIHASFPRIHTLITAKLAETKLAQSDIRNKKISELAVYSDILINEQIDDFMQSDQMRVILTYNYKKGFFQKGLTPDQKKFIPEYSDELHALLEQKTSGKNVDTNIKQYYLKRMKNKTLIEFAKIVGAYDETGLQVGMDRHTLADNILEKVFNKGWASDLEVIIVNEYIVKSTQYGAGYSAHRNFLDGLNALEGFAIQKNTLQTSLVFYDQLLTALQIDADDPLRKNLRAPEGSSTVPRVKR